MARPTLGAELVNRLPGSDFARERMRAVVEVLSGTLSVQDAAARLDVSPQYFDQLRAEALTAGVAALEPKPAGRPPTVHPDGDQPAVVPGGGTGTGAGRYGVDELTALRIELRAAQLREELALVLGPRYKRAKKNDRR
jgi:hypothetical protein